MLFISKKLVMLYLHTSSRGYTITYYKKRKEKKSVLIGYDNQYEFYLPWDLENQRTIKS
jgi:hypothetical protein